MTYGAPVAACITKFGYNGILHPTGSQLERVNEHFHWDSLVTTMASTENLDWEELSAEQQAAAKTLGYTQEIWDGSGKVPADEKDWQELSADEQKAATTLGYDKKTWSKSDNIEDLDWDELNDEQQNAAKKLGYTKDIWDGDKKCPADDLDWEDLTNDQRKAAEVLGYNEDSWNGGGFMATCCTIL